MGEARPGGYGGPEQRETEFVPASEAHKRGWWGRAVSEFPNEAYTLAEIVKKYPGGPVGTDEKPGQESVPRDAQPKRGKREE